MEGERTRRSFRVSGVVQGVGFRWWTRRIARQLGVAGRVRNLSDGSVEVEAEGARRELERLRALLLQGPPGAVVREVLDEVPASGPLPEPFDIAL